MCPTSSAVWKRSRPPHFGQASPSRGSRMSAKRASKSRPCSAPRRCQPVRFAPTTNWPSRSVSSARIGPEKPIGPDRARVGAERVPDLLLGRRPDAAQRGHRLRLLEPVVAADEREHERAVLLHDRHRLRGRRRVDPEEVGERLDRRHPGRLDLGRRVEALGELGRRAGCRARPRGRRRSRRSRR